jgi:type IV pilus assembly protein PilA
MQRLERPHLLLRINNYNKQEENGMFKNMKKQLNNEKGLTLIELLAVIVILAIIAAIAVPAIGKVINNSRDKAILADASNILAGAKIAIVDGACAEGKSGSPAVADGTFVCAKSDLEGFVDAVVLDDGDKVVKAKDGSWSVTYDKLSKIKNTGKFSVTADTDAGIAAYAAPNTLIQESSLNKALSQ